MIFFAFFEIENCLTMTKWMFILILSIKYDLQGRV